jgi:hypothetical protein
MVVVVVVVVIEQEEEEEVLRSNFFRPYRVTLNIKLYICCLFRY